MDSLPQPHGQPAPYIFAAQDQAPETSFDFWGVLNRRKWLVFLGLVCGMALGALYDAQCETIYKSEAMVKIEPKDPLYLQMSQNSRMMLPGAADLAIRHDQLIGQFNIVSRCLLENELTKLRSFENFTEADIVPEVMDNLAVTQNCSKAIRIESLLLCSG